MRSSPITSVYSRLRSIATKRVSRLEAAGFSTGRAPSMPKVGDIKNESQLNREIAKLQNWLTTPEKSTVKGARAAQESRLEAKRARDREYYQREGKYRRKLTKEEKSLLDLARGMGFGDAVNAKNIKDFASYLKYRRSLTGNGVEKQYRRNIDMALEEFEAIEHAIYARQDAIQNNEVNPFNELLNDLNAFLNDQLGLAGNRDGMTGYSSQAVSEYVHKFFRGG